MNVEALKQLGHFTGTEAYHKLTIGPLKATDGVKFLCENADCFWLMDAIASYQQKPQVKALSIQFWRFKKLSGGKAVLFCEPDKDEAPVVVQKFESTDFPLQEQKIWVQGDVAMLPNEY